MGKRWGAQQAATYALTREAGATTALLRGPKGAGKTEAAVCTALAWMTQHHTGQQFAISAPSLKQYRNAILRVARQWCRAAKFEMRPHPDGFQVGSNVFIRCIGKDAGSIGSILSLNLVGAYLCEFNEQPEEYVDELAFSRVRVSTNRLVLLDYNPKGTRHWGEEQYWDRADELGMRKLQFTLDDNPGLEPDWVAQQHLKYPVGTAKHRRYVLGVPADDEGLVYKFVRYSTPPAGQPRALFAGVDAGNSLDHPTAAVLFAEYEQGCWIVDEYRHPTDHSDALLTPEDMAAGMAQAFRRHGRVGSWIVDPAALYMANALKRRGAPRVKLGDNRIKDGIETVDAYLTRGIVRVNRAACPHLARELANYVWDTSSDGRERERVPIKRDDHAVDALRYGCMARNRGIARRVATAQHSDLMRDAMYGWQTQ